MSTSTPTCMPYQVRGVCVRWHLPWGNSAFPCLCVTAALRERPSARQVLKLIMKNNVWGSQAGREVPESIAHLGPVSHGTRSSTKPGEASARSSVFTVGGTGQLPHMPRVWVHNF